VQVRPFHPVQAVVQVPLEQDVPEAIQGQALVTYPPDPLGAHQAMLPVQLAAQALDHLLFVSPPHPGHHLGGESFSLHAGHDQGSLQPFWQPADTLCDHRLHPGWQPIPIQRRALNPPTPAVLYQISPLLHAPQQFEGKERMSSGLLVKGPAERLAQPVGFGVQEGVHKLPVLSLAQIHLDVAKVALELVDDGLEGMSFLSSCDRRARRRAPLGYFSRAVGPHDQDSATLYPPPQVEEQADGAAIHPLQVVQHQQQWPLACQPPQYSGVLLKQGALL
jgi:hypothetical protein